MNKFDNRADDTKMADRQFGIYNVNLAPPILTDTDCQGIAQTGEEDPLASVEDPAVAQAIRSLDNTARMPPTEDH